MADTTPLNNSIAEGSAHSRPDAAPSPQSQPQGTQPSGFTLPKDLEGKSPSEIAQYYERTSSEKYKDYDDLKTRASGYEEYSKLGMKPEDITRTTQWVTNLLANLQTGQRAYFDKQNNRIVFTDDKGNVTGSATQGQQQQPTDFFNEYETLMPAQQGERLASFVWEQRLKPQVDQIVQRYDQMFNQALTSLQAKENMLLEVLDRWMANPKLNPRDLLTKALEIGQGAARNPIDLAAQQLLSPAEIEAKAEQIAAAKFAEMQQKWESEHAAPIMEPPAHFTPRAVRDGKPLTRGEMRNNLLTHFRQNGILRGPAN